MTTAEVSQLRNVHNQLRNDRADVEPFYACASLYADPMGAHRWTTNPHSPNLNWATDLFSGVGMRSTDRFSQFLLGNATPAAARWLKLTDSEVSSDDLDEEQAEYWADATREIEKTLRGHDGAPLSSFYLSKALEFFHLAISYGVCWVYEGEDHNDLTGEPVFKNIDPYGFYYAFDDLGRMSKSSLIRHMTNDQIESILDQRPIEEMSDKSDDGKTHEIAQIVVRNNGASRATPRSHDEWLYQEWFVDLTDDKVIARRGYYSQPFHVMGWRQVPGSSYFVGPAYGALPNMISANAAEKAKKKAQEMTAFPPLLGGKRNSKAVKTLRPGAVTWEAIDERNRPLIQPLQGLANPGGLYQDVAEEEQRASNAFFEFDMNLPGQANMSATEVAERAQQRAAMVAPFALRVEPSIKGQIARAFDIKSRAGTMPDAPLSVQQDGRFGAELVGPLSLAARQTNIVTMMQTLDQIAVIDQLPTESIDKAEARLAVASSAGHEELLRDPAQVQAEQREQAELLAAQQQATANKEQSIADRNQVEAVNAAIN